MMHYATVTVPEHDATEQTGSLLLKHTSLVCLVFGAACSTMNSSLDALFGIHLGTAEAHLFARHFGLANLLISFFCDSLMKAQVTSGVKIALLAWHGMVLLAFAYEILAKRVWQSSPFVTRACFCIGVLLHAVIFCEGVVEAEIVTPPSTASLQAFLGAFTNVGGQAGSLGAGDCNLGGPQPDWLRTAALQCSFERRVMIGVTSAASFAVIYDPLGRFLLRRCKSINDGHSSVPRYWPTVLGSLLQIATWIAASTRVLPVLSNVTFRFDEAAFLNTLPAMLLCMCLAEFGILLEPASLVLICLYTAKQEGTLIAEIGSVIVPTLTPAL